MKPRTKIQKEVEALRMKLPPINERQRTWAIGHCYDGVGYVCKGEVWCSHCGRTHIKPISPLGVSLNVEKKTKCPYCHRVLQLENSRAKKKELVSYMTLVTTIGGWQVLRHVEVRKYLYKLPKAVSADCASTYMCEVVQHWVNEEGKCVTVSRPRGYGYGKYKWVTTKEMEIRDISRMYSYEQNFYNIEGEVYPFKHVIPILKRNGYNGYIPKGISMCDIFVLLLTRTESETLIKARQYELLEWMGRSGLPLWMWPSIRIAIRNKYRVKDVSLWHDMLNALMYLGKDMRNSHYVCPKDLKAAHDRWVKLMENVKKKRKREKQLREIRKNEESYRAEKQRFFGVSFCEDGITIEPIKSVAEMEEEGREMSHCVFANEYYKKKGSLILSAKDNNGKRLETIEVLLDSGKVNQCFGKQNCFTLYHEKILKIVNEHIIEIMRVV